MNIGAKPVIYDLYCAGEPGESIEERLACAEAVVGCLMDLLDANPSTRGTDVIELPATIRRELRQIKRTFNAALDRERENAASAASSFCPLSTATVAKLRQLSEPDLALVRVVVELLTTCLREPGEKD